MTSTVSESVPAVPDQSKAIPPVGRKRGALHVLKVGKLDRLTDDAVAITFVVPDELRDEFRYQAGQHLAVRATIAGDDVRRNYSVCAPAGSGVLRIGVKRLPDGVFSNYALERLQVGDNLEVLPPTGTFTTTFDPARTRHYGAVAAGSGITPVLSILATALQTEPNSRATLIYVNPTTSSVMFLEDLEDLKNTYLDRFKVVHVLDGERQEVELLSGRLDAQRLTTILDNLVYPDVDEWFLCGPLAMTDTIRETLLARGVADEHIRRELFHVAATPPRRKLTKSDEQTHTGYGVTVVLDGRGTSFQLPPNTETVLDAALQLRGEVPYACKNGVCGTCRCRLVSGTVEMVQNFALEKEEVDRGYRLACQSYPTSDNVVMDFDQ
jgi:ring-1,2-phenylacetyl-CoA epoxidase subunit PaaE